MNTKTILAIETSCDETAMSVVQFSKSKTGWDFEVLSNIVASQIDLHKKWGGVYPELASRAHLEAMIPVLREATKPLAQVKSEKLKVKSLESCKIENSVDAIAVTVGPGLIGSLLMGVETAQILGAYFHKPIIPVNHLEGHIYSAFADERIMNNESGIMTGIMNRNHNSRFMIHNSNLFPILALVVSGGHTSLILMKDHLKYETVGQTIDDAAGEAFDKVARILGFGYPGGPEIEKFAIGGNENKYKLPIARLDNKLNFSFSGLKTAVLYLVKPPKKHYEFRNKLIMSSKAAPGVSKSDLADLAASFQKTVCQTLTEKTILAIKKYQPKTVILSGGVSANGYLRERFVSEISKLPTPHALPEAAASLQAGPHPTILIPPKNLSTDNALGIAIAGALRAELASTGGALKFSKNLKTDYSKIEADANLKL